MKETVCVGVVGAGIISDIYLQNMTGRFDNLRVKAVSAVTALPPVPLTTCWQIRRSR